MKKFIFLFIILFLLLSTYSFAEKETFSAPKFISPNQDIFLHLVIENKLLADTIRDKNIKSVYKSDLIIENPNEEFYVSDNLIIWSLQGTVSKNNNPKDYKFSINMDNKFKKDTIMSLIDIEIKSSCLNKENKFISSIDSSYKIGNDMQQNINDNIIPIEITLENLKKEYESECYISLSNGGFTNEKGEISDYLSLYNQDNLIPYSSIKGKKLCIRTFSTPIFFNVKINTPNPYKKTECYYFSKIYECEPYYENLNTNNSCTFTNNNEILIGNLSDKENILLLKNSGKINFKINGDSVKFYTHDSKGNNSDITKSKDLQGEFPIDIEPIKPGVTELNVNFSDFNINRSVVFNVFETKISIPNAKYTKANECEIDFNKPVKVYFDILGPTEKIQDGWVEINTSLPYYFANFPPGSPIYLNLKEKPEFFELKSTSFTSFPIPIEFILHLPTGYLSSNKLTITQKLNKQELIINNEK